MSIQALPPSTVRIIGSSQVLTDSASIVKELVDNALDARATSVFVEIASNTLDIIQLRDNGHGISPDDRAMVCRRYCTSKIKDYGDLKDLGGKFLGFRGEALASAAELSSSMIVTTRVEGENVAVALKISRQGEVEKQDRASHPVGTTIRLNDVLKCLPVRRQTALKTITKTLAKVKRLLQAYALARPNTRFSLRVLKAKNDKANWMYGPKPSAKVEDAAFSIIGPDCAGQCEWSAVQHNGFEIQAFLPRPTANGSKISNIGSFIFVDSRPVSTSRGTLKQINTLYKERLRSSSASLANVKDPFIWLNIICPPQSYDPNIELAKDDVMFEDSGKVLEAVEALLDGFYPAPAPQQQDTEATGPEEIHEDEPELEADSRLERGISATHHVTPQHVIHEEPILLDDESQAAIQEDDVESSAGSQDVNISNPWVTAKLHSSNLPRRISSKRNGQLVTPLQERNSSSTNSSSLTEPVSFPPHPPWALPTPENSSSPQRGARDHAVEPYPVRSALTTAGDLGVQNNRQDVNEHQIPHAEHHNGWRGWTAINDFIPAGQLPLGTQTPELPPDITSFPKAGRRRARHNQAHASGINSHLVSPVQDESRVWFNNHSSVPTAERAPSSNKRGRQYPDLDLQHVFDSAEEAAERIPKRRRHCESTAESMTDADGTEDQPDANIGIQSTIENFFSQQRRNPRSGLEESEDRVQVFSHRRTDLSARPALTTQAIKPSTFMQSATTSRRGSTSPDPQIPASHTRRNRALSRALSRTSRLPLERVPAGAEIHNLLHNVSLSVQVLAESLRRVLELDDYGVVGMPGWTAAARRDPQDIDDEAQERVGPHSENTIVNRTACFQPPLDENGEDIWAARLDQLLRNLNSGEERVNAFGVV